MRAASWIMTRLGVPQTLIGDIIEQRQDGRSLTWVCAQTIAAIVSAILSDFRTKPWLAVRAVLFGLLLRAGHKALWSFLWRYIDPALGRVFHYGLALSWADMLMAVPGWLLIGWLVARFHRGTLVFAYLFATWLLLGPDYSRQLSNALAEARFRPYFVVQTVGQILFAISVLAGALSSRRADAIR